MVSKNSKKRRQNKKRNQSKSAGHSHHRSGGGTWTCGIFPRNDARGFIGVWLDDQRGAVLSMGQVQGLDDLDGLIRQMRRAVQLNPFDDQPPAVVRVLSSSLRETLLGRLPGSPRVVYKPDSAFESVIAEAVQMLDDDEDAEALLSEADVLGRDIPSDVLARYFEAMTVLRDAQPWRAIDSDVSRLGVQIPSRGLEHGIVLVFGEDDQAPGLYLFKDAATVDRFLIAVGGTGDLPGDPGALPRLTIVYQHRDDFTEETLGRIEEAGWKLSETGGVPVLVTPAGEEGGPTAEDYRLATTLCDGLARFTREHRDELKGAWEDDAAVVQASYGASTESDSEATATWTAPAPVTDDASKLVILNNA